MAVNENIYGNRADWTTPGSAQDWSGDNIFLDQFYPKIKTGCPQGQTDGRLSNLLAANTISRDTTIDSSPAWVYTSINPQPIGYEWAAASSFTFDNLYKEGKWVGDTYHNDLTPVMFQVYRYTGDTSIGTLTGIDGWFAPSSNPDLVRSVKQNQAKMRFSPGPPDTEVDLEDAIICANDTERFALTQEQVDPMYQTVYVQDTTNMYYVKDRTKLNVSAGYQFMWSLNDYLGNNSSPITSFCPKNFILEINITYGTVVDGTEVSSPQSTRRIRARPDGLFSSETIPLADFTPELIQQRLDDIATYLHNYEDTHGSEFPWSVYLVVFGMHCKVYNRSQRDSFTYTRSGSGANTPIFNVLFNGGIRLSTMAQYESPIVRYTYNQNSSGSLTYSNLPLLGDISGGTGSNINIGANYSRGSYWENHTDFTWWASNASYIPVLLGVNLQQCWYERVGDSIYGYGYRVVPNVFTISTAGDVSVIKEYAHERAAQYGLFFCDKYSALSASDTPRVWVDPDMMCGTFVEQDGIRITTGNFTSGLNNMNQPQFRMVDSEGNTWNPDTTFYTDNDYPQMTSWDMIEFDEAPLPVNDVMTAQGNYPEYPYWQLVDMPSFPTPYSVFVAYGAYPHIPTWDEILIGAFAGVRNLGQVTIPQSVTSIGYTAFAKTAITSVTISQECEFYDESFPAGCEVKFYP